MNDDDLRRLLRQGSRVPRRGVDLDEVHRRGLRRRATVVGGGATLTLVLAAAVVISLPPSGEVLTFSPPGSDSIGSGPGARSEPSPQTVEAPPTAAPAPHDPATEPTGASSPEPDTEEPRQERDVRRFQITAAIDVLDATAPVPFTVDVTDPGVVSTATVGSHEVGFTSTDGTVYLDDPRFRADLQGAGVLRTAGRNCDATSGFCDSDFSLLRTDEGERTPTKVELYAGELAPGTYVLQQPVAWSSAEEPIEINWSGNYPGRGEPDGRATVRIVYEVTAA